MNCDANEMSEIDNDEKLINAAKDANMVCNTLWDDTSPITPFYLPSHAGRTKICEHLRNGAKSTCEATTSGPHQRFCFCKAMINNTTGKSYLEFLYQRSIKKLFSYS